MSGPTISRTTPPRWTVGRTSPRSPQLTHTPVHALKPAGGLAPSLTACSAVMSLHVSESTSRASSATPTLLGTKVVSKTPSDISDEHFHERPTSLLFLLNALLNSSRPTTIRHESASTTALPPKYSGTICCTSNVNPPPSSRWDDGGSL